MRSAVNIYAPSVDVMNVKKNCEYCQKQFKARKNQRWCSHSCCSKGYPRGVQRRPLAERFEEKFQRGSADDCWEWQGHCNSGGYGTINEGGRGRPLLAHRVAFEFEYGPISDDLKVCHDCDNPPCCNPRHLFLGTMADNSADQVGKERQARGESCGRSKLTETEVQEIRKLLRSDQTQAEIAQRFSVNASLISRIKTGEVWGWLESGG